MCCSGESGSCRCKFQSLAMLSTRSTGRRFSLAQVSAIFPSCALVPLRRLFPGGAVPGHIPAPCRIEIYPDSAARGGSRTGGTGIEISQADHRAHRRLRTACRQTAGNPHGDGTHSRFRSRCGWGLAGCGTGCGGLFSGYRSAGRGSCHAGRHSGRPAAAADPFALLSRNGGDQSGHHLHRPRTGGH